MKIAFIGAGSFVFTRKLVIDFFSFADMPDAEFALMDINADRLMTVKTLVEKVLLQERRAVRVTATQNRAEALDGADFVIAMYEPDGLEARRREVMTCIAHDVPMAIGDTLGASGVFKGIRTGLVALSIARDMQKYCPNALYMNYVNPMATNCWVINAATKIRTVGMCHGLEHTRTLLAKWLEVSAEELELRAFGINHMTWILDITHNGRDMYPELRRRIDLVREEDAVRAAILEATDYYVTESSYHSAEYVPYFRSWFKSLLVNDVPSPRCNCGMGGWGGQIIWPSTGPIGRTEPKIPLAWDIYLYEKVHSRTWETAKKQLMSDGRVAIERSEEYAMRVIHSHATGDKKTMSLNVPNRGYIENLPAGATVELPVTVDKQGLHPAIMGALPEPCASLCRRNIEVQDQIVSAVINEDPRAAFNAVMLDPLTGASLDPAGIRTLFNALIDADAEFLPEWLRKGKTMGPVYGARSPIRESHHIKMQAVAAS